MDRETRNLIHKKQERIESRVGSPSPSEMIEDVPQFRLINGELYFCVLRKGIIYYWLSGVRNVTQMFSSPASNHAVTHELGGIDQIDHDDLKNFVANEHIDWTNTSESIVTTGNISCVKLTTAGGRVKGTTRITDTDSPYTVLATDHTIYCDTGSGAITVNLPAGIDGTEYVFVNVTNSNLLTITPDGAELLDGVNASKSMGKGILDLRFESTEGWW